VPLLNGTNTWSGVQTVANGSVSAPGIVFAGQAGTGLSYSLSGIYSSVSGAERFRVSASWNWSRVPLYLTQGVAALDETVSNILHFKNGTTATAMHVMNTYSTSTSYEAGVMDWRTTSNTLRIGSDVGSGGGSARDVQMIRGGVTKETLGANTNDDAQPRKLYSCTYTGRPNAATVGAGALVYMTSCNCTVAGANVTATGTGTCVAISDGTNWVALFVLAAGA